MDWSHLDNSVSAGRVWGIPSESSHLVALRGEANWSVFPLQKSVSLKVLPIPASSEEPPTAGGGWEGWQIL